MMLGALRSLLVPGLVGLATAVHLPSLSWFSGQPKAEAVATPCREGRVAIVTGGSRGLGRDIVFALAADKPSEGSGADHIGHIVCVSRGLAGCEETAQHVNDKFPSKSPGCLRASAYSVDVSNGADVKVLVDKIVQDRGKVDILVNNAGITKDKLLMRMTVDDWKDVIGTNLNSVFYFTKAVMRKMMAEKWGRIVNIASISGLGGQAGQINYSASKAGVIGFTKALAKEIGSFNVTVNAVAPGFIESHMTQKLKPAARESSMKGVPAGRFGMPEEVGKVVSFLTSEEASYVSGSVVVVDGGLMFGMS